MQLAHVTFGMLKIYENGRLHATEILCIAQFGICWPSGVNVNRGVNKSRAGCE